MTNNTHELLYKYLCNYLTKKKEILFSQIITNRTRHLTVAFEHMSIEHNRAASLRSCELFGIQDVHIIEGTTQLEKETCVNKGAAHWLTKKYYQTSQACVENLRNNGYQIAVTALNANSIPLDEFDITKKTAIIFGTEETGVSNELIKAADSTIIIPMYGFTQSFNVSVSVGIILHTLTTKLRQSSIAWNLTDEEKIQVLIDWAEKTVPAGKELIAHWNLKNV